MNILRFEREAAPLPDQGIPILGTHGKKPEISGQSPKETEPPVPASRFENVARFLSKGVTALNQLPFLGTALALGGGTAMFVAPRWLPISTFAAGCLLCASSLRKVSAAATELKDKAWPAPSSGWVFARKAIALGALTFLVYHVARVAGAAAPDVYLHNPDPGRQQAFRIQNFEALLNAETLNNISFQHLEWAARDFSGTGFLGYTERMKDVMVKDWKAVDHLGTTHIELAMHLNELWRRVDANWSTCSYNKHGGYVGPCSWSNMVLYDPSQLEGNTLGTGPQLLCVCDDAYRGLQSDIFGPENNYDSYGQFQRGHSFPPPADGPGESGPWARELYLYNPLNGVSIIAGGAPPTEQDPYTAGVLNYIENYGFYEGGGSENPYRVDPVDLVALLTGQPVCDLRKEVGQPCGLRPEEPPLSNMDIWEMLRETGQACVCHNNICTDVLSPGHPAVIDSSECLQL